MYVHPPSRCAYIAWPRAASREVGSVLERRGFLRLFDHHDFVELPGYTHWSMVRNHFDVARSLLAMKPTTDLRINPQWGPLYPCPGIMWLPQWEIEGCRTLRYERLRRDVDTMLRTHGLRGLGPLELTGRWGTATAGKLPLTTEQAEIIKDEFKAELHRFRYEELNHG